MSEEVLVRPTFEQVHAKTRPLVRRWASRLGVTSSAVDDIVQDVYLVVYRRFDRFQGRCSIEAWVFGILERLVRNHRRWLRRKGAGLAISACVSDPEILEDDREGPFELASRREAERWLQAQLARFDQRSVAVLLLSDLRGMTIAQIAAATDTNLNTVYSRRRAARSALRRAVDQGQIKPLSG